MQGSDPSDGTASRRGPESISRRVVLQTAGALGLVTALSSVAGPARAAGAWGGHENGRIPVEALTRLTWAPAQRLEVAAAAALEQLDLAFRDAFGGVDLHVSDSYRTFEQQVAVRARKPRLAAVPGTSNHGWAQAVDLGSGINGFGTVKHDWMSATAPAYGWVNPHWARPRSEGGKGEPWHWEYVGTGAPSSSGADPDSDPTPGPPPLEEEMAILVQSTRGFALLDGGSMLPVVDQASIDAYRAAGLRLVAITDADFDRHLAASTSTFLLMNRTRGYAIWSGGKGIALGDIATVDAFKAQGIPVITVGDADFARFMPDPAPTGAGQVP